jgi:hypothetical protein
MGLTPEAFSERLINLIVEQNKEFARFSATSARQEELLKQLVSSSEKASVEVAGLKKDFTDHKKDAITWSKLGKIGATVTASLGFILAVAKVLSEFRVF